MNIYHVRHGNILPLGKQGENMARKIQFDISRWIGTFGPGTVQLLHQRSGDDAPYPVAVEKDGTQAIWTVTNADTAAAGTGRAELQYYVGDALAKSETWMTKVLAALGPAGEMPPEAQQGWVDQVLAQVAKITGMTAQAVELPAGSAPTADYTDGVLTIGIPLGGDVSEAQIAQAVAEYLAKNPIAETDPTVPDWAKEETKPSYTAAEVGADPSGTAASQVSAHNTETTAHSDLRLLIQGLTERLKSLADSDDTTLDQLSEIVAYIKSNRKLIEAITTSKVSVADIIDNLTTNVANKPLSAAQGVALKAMIDAITIPTALPNPNALTFTGAVSGSYDGSAPLEVEIPSGGGGLTVTNTAAVGQTIKVSAVDENGQPTEWEAVDMAEQVQPDWNQNDSTQPDYVKNRPFYTSAPVETVVFEEQTANFTVGKPIMLPYTEDEETNKLYESIFDGATIRIVWDGEIYDCVTVGGGAGNFTLINGSGGNNEPFFLSLREFMMLAAESGEHTFSITYIEANVYKIEEKYLPDTVIKSNYAAYTMPVVKLDGVFDLTYFSNETSGGYSKTCTTEQWDDISKLLLGARANYMVYATSRQVESCAVYSNYKLKIWGSRISETGSFKVNVSLLEYDVNNETLTVTYCADKASIP